MILFARAAPLFGLGVRASDLAGRLGEAAICRPLSM
jgi:hypothetical protein